MGWISHREWGEEDRGDLWEEYEGVWTVSGGDELDRGGRQGGSSRSGGSEMIDVKHDRDDERRNGLKPF